MTPLVSLEEAREWVFSTQPENDPFLDQLTALATGIVMDYVGATDPVTGVARTWTVVTVPDPVRAAILLVLTDLWAHRGDGPQSGVVDGGLGSLPPAAMRYLQRFREPVVS